MRLLAILGILMVVRGSIVLIPSGASPTMTELYKPFLDDLALPVFTLGTERPVGVRCDVLLSFFRANSLALYSRLWILLLRPVFIVMIF